jgi:hypothetical protein
VAAAVAAAAAAGTVEAAREAAVEREAVEREAVVERAGAAMEAADDNGNTHQYSNTVRTSLRTNNNSPQPKEAQPLSHSRFDID